MSDVALVEVTDGNADVRLNRGHAMNAFNDDMFEALIEVGQSLRAETGLRAVVLSGARWENEIRGGNLHRPRRAGMTRATWRF